MVTKLTVEIDADLQQRAKAIAEKQGRTLADVVQSALETYVEQSASSEPQRLMETDPIFQMAGRYSGSPENISENVEDILTADIDPIRGLSVRRAGNGRERCLRHDRPPGKM